MIWSSLTAPIRLVDSFNQLVLSFLILSFLSLNPKEGLFRTMKVIKDKAHHGLLADVVLILIFIFPRRFDISTQGGPFPDHNGHQGQSPPRILPMLSCSWNILFFVDLIPQPRAGLFRTIKVIKDKARPRFWTQGRRRWFGYLTFGSGWIWCLVLVAYGT